MSSISAGGASLGPAQGAGRPLSRAPADPRMVPPELEPGASSTRRPGMNVGARELEPASLLARVDHRLLGRGRSAGHGFYDIERILRDRITRGLDQPDGVCVVEGPRLIQAGFSEGRLEAITGAWRGVYVFRQNRGSF